MDQASHSGETATALRRPLSRRRRLVFILLATTVVPAILLSTAEVVLRLGGVGYRSRFFVPGDEGEWFSNPDVTRRSSPATSQGSPCIFASRSGSLPIRTAFLSSVAQLRWDIRNRHTVSHGFSK